MDGYVRYLSSKRSVDDRALNKVVIQDLADTLQSHAHRADELKCLRVVEAGAGVGDMLPRLLNAGCFRGYPHVEYTMIDIKRELLEAARQRLVKVLRTGEYATHKKAIENASVAPNSDRLQGHGSHAVRESADGTKLPSLTVRTQFCEHDTSVSVSFVASDALSYLKESPQCASFDLVVASALLDVVDYSEAVRTLLGSLSHVRGVCAFYFPINFDGVTHFSPETSYGASVDAAAEAWFHERMGRHADGTPRAHTGRALLSHLITYKPSRLKVGGSTWVVHAANEQNGYDEDEAYFVSTILGFMAEDLRAPGQRPECLSDAVSAGVVSERQKQLEANVLCYIAHNVDYSGALGRTQ